MLEITEKNLKILKAYVNKVKESVSEMESIVNNDFKEYDGYYDFYGVVHDLRSSYRSIKDGVEELQYESMMANASMKNPLVAKKVSTANGIEMSIENRFDNDADLLVYQVFCEMIEGDEYESFAEEFDSFEKFEPVISEIGKGGLTEKQKKLPKKMQKAILKKMKKKKEISEEEAEAEYSKLLSKDDEKEYENTIEHEMKVKK